MAGKTPNDPKKSNDKKKSWLSTNDWLGVPPVQTPMPIDPPEPVKSSGPPSSKIIAKSDLADQSGEDDDAIDLATPPGGATTGPPSLSKILKATGTKSDIIRGAGSSTKLGADGQDYQPTAPAAAWMTGKRTPAPKTGGSSVSIGNPPRPGEDVSDIFTGDRADNPGGTGSNLLPGMSGVGRSSVFGTDSRSGSSGGESDLFVGLSGIGERGSSVYDDSDKRTQRVNPDADIFSNADSHADMAPPDDSEVRPISSGPPSSARLADRLLAGLADSAAMARPDFNALDKSPQGSNLFDDVTAMDIDLGSDGPSGASGVNWLDPNRTGAQDSGPGSSIFQKNPGGESTGGGVVDLTEIPMMGSTDDPDEMVQNSDLAGPPSTVLKKELQKAMRELNAEGGVTFDLPAAGSDARAGWGTARSSIEEQYSMRMPVSDDELDLAAPPPSGAIHGLPVVKSTKKESDSVFDDVLVAPGESGILERHSETKSRSILDGASNERLAYKGDATARAAAPATRQRPPSAAEFRTRPIPKTKNRRGMLIGALSLLAGTGIGAAGMYALQDNSPRKSGAVNPDGTPVAAVASLDEANRLIATGDIVGANTMLRAVKGDSPETRAAVGQARWMSRLRDAASVGEKIKLDDDAIVAAKADLQSVMDRSAGLKTPAEQQAGLKAALNLGLIAEATGKPKEAIGIYRSAAVKLPAYKKVFDAAARRVDIMSKKPDGSELPGNQYAMANDAIFELAGANAVLLDFDPVQPIDDEPGFYFWDAIQQAATPTTTNNLDKAIDNLKKARSTHLARKAKYAGMGLNPLTDPAEQMFVRACDEMIAYYSMKKKIYEEPVLLALAKGDPSKKVAGKKLDDLLTDLLDTKRNAKTISDQLAAAKKAADTANKNRDTLQAASNLLQEQVATLNKSVTDAKATAAAAADKVKVAEASLDEVITKLKAEKLIDEKVTREQALALVPKLVFTRGDADLTKKIASITQEYTAAKADAAKKIGELESAVKKFDTELAAANEKARKAASDAAAATKAQEESRSALAKAEEARRDIERKAREAEETYQRNLASARAGVAVSLTDAERTHLDNAVKAYSRGLEAFTAGRYSDAESALADAVANNPNDAAAWYFLGLAKWNLGRAGEAAVDFKKGAALPQPADIGSRIMTVQGPARAALDAVRP